MMMLSSTLRHSNVPQKKLQQYEDPFADDLKIFGWKCSVHQGSQPKIDAAQKHKRRFSQMVFSTTTRRLGWEAPGHSPMVAIVLVT